MIDTQRSPAAGAGINPVILETDETVRKEMQKSLPHYVFSPGEKIGLGDRQISVPELIPGRLNLISNHSYMERNRSPEYIKGNTDEPETVIFTKSAADSVDEILGAFIVGERRKVYKIESLTGIDARRAQMIEEVLVPEVPTTLKKYISHLSTVSIQNIEESLTGDDAKLAEKVRQEMLKAVRAVLSFQMAYLDRTERELINSRKPNGKGKSSLDDVDKRYYQLCERKRPLEADLDFVADQEVKAEGIDTGFQGSGPLAEAIKLLAERLPSAPQEPSTEIASLWAELEETKERFNKLLDMVEVGKVPTKSKKAKAE